MMSYLQRLQMQRGAPAQNAIGGVAPVGVDQVKGDGVKTGDQEPALRREGGIHPAPKKDRGLSAAHLRQTIGDLFQRGASVGLPPSFIAKHGRALEQEGANLEKLAGAIKDATAKLAEPAKSTVAGLFGRIATAASEELARLDNTAQASALHDLIGGFSAAVERKLQPTPAQARAIEDVAASISTIHHEEMGSLIVRALERITGAEPARASSFSALCAAMDTIAGSAGDGGLGLIAGAAIDTAAGVPLGKRGEALTAGQQKILAQLGRDVEKQAAADARAEKAAAAEIARSMKKIAPAQAKLGGLIERAKTELSAPSFATWLGVVTQLADKPREQLFAAASIQLAVLSQLGPEAPAALAQRALERAALSLARVPGMTEAALSALADGPVRRSPPEKVPGLLEIVARILTATGKGGDANLVVLLADGLTGRTDSFAKADGPGAYVEGALQAAKDVDRARAIASFAPRFAEAAKKAEAGTTRDELEAKFAADCSAVAGAKVEPSALAAAHPTIPEDSLLRLAAIGIGARRDLDKWFTTLSSLFEQTRGNKEHVRSLRSLFVLADKCGANAPQLADALIKADLKPQMLMKTANAILSQDNRDLKKANVEKAIAMLGRGEDVATEIESAMRRAMVKELELDQLLKDANVKVTDAGFKAVSGPLAEFFSDGVNGGEIEKPLLRKVLVAALEDRIQAFRFETKAAVNQLKALNPAQRRAWEETQTMTHVRLKADGREELESRINSAAKLGRALEARMTEAWGELKALKAEHDARVAELRDLPKGKVAERRRLIAEVAGLPSRIRALEWARALGKLTAETTTPLRFASMADELPKLGRALGPGMRALVEELLWTIRIDDLDYSEVITTDGPDLATMYNLASTNCLGGDLPAILAYCIDPNKRMIVTKNQAGEERRAVMRVVERKDKGHAGEPMLVLERTYPDTASEDEKQRIVEHMLRRATDMGIAAAYPLEYYWEIKKTNRFAGHDDLHDTKKVIEDLNRRYGTTAHNETIKVLSRAGNMEHEYIDSAPLAGAADAGNMQQRLYDRADVTYENKFMILEPARGLQ